MCPKPRVCTALSLLCVALVAHGLGAQTERQTRLVLPEVTPEVAPQLSLALLGGGTRDFTNVVFSDDGRFLACNAAGVGPGVGVVVYDIGTGRLVRYLESGVPLAIISTPATLITRDDRGAVRALDLGSGRVTAEWALDRAVQDVVASDDGRVLAHETAAWSGVAVRDSVSGAEIALLPSLAFQGEMWLSHDGRVLACRSGVGKVALYDIATGALRYTIDVGNIDLPSSVAVAISPCGRWVAAGGDGRNVTVVHAATGKARGTLVAEGSSLTRLRFSPSGDTLAGTVSFPRGRTSLWSLATGQAIGVTPYASEKGTYALTPDGLHIAVAEEGARSLDICSIQSGETVVRLGSSCLDPQWLFFDVGSNMLLTETSDGVASGWGLATGQRRYVGMLPPGTLQMVTSMYMDGVDGKLAYRGRALVANAQGHVDVLDPEGEAWQQVAAAWLQLSGARPDVRELSSQGAVLRFLGALAADEPAPGPMVLRQADGSLAFSWFGPAGDGSVRHLDPLSGQTLALYSPATLGPGGLLAYPDKRAEAVVVVRLPSLEPVARLDGLTGLVDAAVAFSDDGRRALVSVLRWRAAASIWVWNLDSGERHGVDTGALFLSIEHVAMSGDGSTVFVAGQDKVLPYGADEDEAVSVHSIWRYDAVSGEKRSFPVPIPWQNVAERLVLNQERQELVLLDVTAQQASVVLVDATDMSLRARLTLQRPFPAPPVALDASGRWLAAATDRGTVELWDLHNDDTFAEGAQPAATLVSFNGTRDWAVVTPQGYFDGSMACGEKLAWDLGGTLYPIEQFAEQYQRADAVRRVFAGESPPEADALTGGRVPPVVAFNSPEYGSVAKGDTVPVELEAAGAAPVSRVEVTANGRPLAEDMVRGSTTEELAGGGRIYRFELAMPSVADRIRLRAVAYDESLIRSRPAETLVTIEGRTPAVGRLHVLSVGVSQYKNPEWNTLRFADKDAEAFAEAAGSASSARVIVNEAATASSLKYALHDLRNQAVEGDTVAVFIAGHGVVAPSGDYYFLVHDSTPEDLPNTAIAWRDFVDLLREVRAQQIILFADTCHSGSVSGSGGVGDLADRLNRDAGVVVFAASGSQQASIEREDWGHGAFTKAILEALAGQADTDPKDGRVSLAEIQTYVTDRVVELTSGRQTPELPRLENFDPEALIAVVTP